MRFIPWDDELAQKVNNNFKVLEKAITKNSTTGCVSEALVQKYYNQPINLEPTYYDDGGGDLLVNGAKVDVKSQANNVNWFGTKNSTGSVACYHSLRAEVYLFVSIDPINKKIALIGWLTPEEIMEKGKFVKKGELVCGRPSNGDCYRISASDLWPIE